MVTENGGKIWLEGSHYSEVGGQRLAAEFFPPSIVYPIKTEEVVRDRYVMGTTQTVAGDYKFQLKGLSESYESHS